MTRIRIRDRAPRVAAIVTALLLAAWAGESPAVRPGEVSFTAAAVCDYRAVAALHDDPALRGRDTLAGKFCAPMRLPRDYRAARDVIDLDPAAWVGYFYTNARTRHIDAWVDRAAAEGFGQVVVLGAGFDSRAYRFHDAHPALRFFELDLPDTIAAKERAVARVLGGLPAHVRYVPIDFDRQPLDAVLPAAGYDARVRTLFILEGVTMYVAESGTAATMDFVAHHAASGSVLVYDYLLRQVVQGDFTGLPGAAREAAGVASVGEPYVTGWTPAEAAAFARAHGLQVLHDYDSAALARRYLVGRAGVPDGPLPAWFHVVDARVH